MSCHLQRQVGSMVCGLFSIAMATALCYDDDPTSMRWDQESMRSHLISCLKDGEMLRFPTNNEQGSPGEIGKMQPIKVHCMCRMRHNTRKERMAQCTTCGVWFHEKCLDIPKTVFTKKSPWACTNLQLHITLYTSNLYVHDTHSR